MALPKEESVYRCVVELTGQGRLDDELGLFGHGVGPRFEAHKGQSRMRARGAEGEDWCLRRLLIGLAACSRLRMPTTLRVTDQANALKHTLPDAVLEQSGGDANGIEVTEATTQAYQRELTEGDRTATERAVDVEFISNRDMYIGNAPERQAVDEIKNAYERKLKKLRSGKYDGIATTDLLVYLNSEVGTLIDPAKVADLVRPGDFQQDGDRQFRQLHILLGDTLVLDALGNSREVVSLYGRYEHDFNQWCFDQAQAALEGDLDHLDLDNIAEELKSLGASDRRALESQIERLLEHLLKWTYQPNKRSRSWLKSMHDARGKIDVILDDSPSLARQDMMEKLIKDNYRRAVKGAFLETGLKRGTFPDVCPFTLQQIFDPDFPAEDEYPGNSK